MSRLGDGAVALARRAHDQADRAPSGDLGANVEAELLEGALEGHVQAAVEFPRGRAARVSASHELPSRCDAPNTCTVHVVMHSQLRWRARAHSADGRTSGCDVWEVD